MLFKLEIGRKLEYWEESSPGFFKTGVTAASLKQSGKTPSANERLAKVVINSEKTAEQDLIKEVGIKSTDEAVQSVCQGYQFLLPLLLHHLQSSHSPINSLVSEPLALSSPRID